MARIKNNIAIWILFDIIPGLCGQFWVVSSVGQPRYVDIVKVAGFMDKSPGNGFGWLAQLVRALR